MDQEDRIALFLDYENLALGARDDLGGMTFDLRPISDALAERGRVVVRRSYADWSYFDPDRRMLTRAHVELIDIPQRMGGARKNAADIKLAADVLEMAFERTYLTTFVIGTGDSDFTPLVHKLRELNKRVIGLGIEASTSGLLPPACDEFLFYDRLEGVEVPPPRIRRRSGRAVERERPAILEPTDAEPTGPIEPAEPEHAEPEHAVPEPAPAPPPTRSGDANLFAVLVAQTVAGLQRSTGGPVTASALKRALVRKDPTLDVTDLGFPTFGGFLQYLAGRNVVELREGPTNSDPEVTLPEDGDQETAFQLLRSVVADLSASGAPVAMSGLKDQLRRIRPDFSEKKFGYRSFLQFCQAAATSGAVQLEWNQEADAYLLTAGS